jgi:hypothetical protein
VNFIFINLFEKINISVFSTNNKGQDYRCSAVVKHLSSICESPGLLPRTAKEEKEKGW